MLSKPYFQTAEKSEFYLADHTQRVLRAASRMFPPLPPAQDSLEGQPHKIGDWVTIIHRLHSDLETHYRAVITAFRTGENYNEPLVQVIYETPRSPRKRNKPRIGAEWLKFSLVTSHEPGVMAETLSHPNPLIRAYFKLLHDNEGKLVVAKKTHDPNCGLAF